MSNSEISIELSHRELNLIDDNLALLGLADDASAEERKEAMDEIDSILEKRLAEQGWDWRGDSYERTKGVDHE